MLIKKFCKFIATKNYTYISAFYIVVNQTRFN
jgi:hypothetical protein